MDIEQIFAAAVFNAKRRAAASTKAGVPQTESDQIGVALSYLWPCARALGTPSAEIQGIVDRYVVDVNGEQRRRSVDPDKVTSLR